MGAAETAASILAASPLFLIPVLVVIVGWFWQFREAESRFQQWAERSGYRVIDRRYRVFR